MNMKTHNLSLANGNVMINGNGIVYFYGNSARLVMTYTGSRVVLWPGCGTSTSIDWYGLGMNNYQLVYNAATSAVQSVPVNGTQVAYFNSGGLVAPSSTVTIGSAAASTQMWVQNRLALPMLL